MSEGFEGLADRVRGRVLEPGDDDYSEARSVWNARVDRRPAAIVCCAGAADVLAAVEHARDQDLPLSVRGGGHHVAGHAVCEDGLMLHLGGMNEVRVDPRERRARVGPGTTVWELTHEAQAFGLATTGAPVAMVGMAGYTLGGGLGWTSRAHGLACDNLVSADVVTAGGELVRASEEENSDLFWALRGGGGNFGVVTSFEYRLHELGPEVLAGTVVHPMESAGEVLRVWRDRMSDAPDALQCMPLVLPLPPDPDGDAGAGETVLALGLLWAGDPSEGRRAMRPLREAGEPLDDTVGTISYAPFLRAMDDMFRSGHRNYYRTAFFDDLPDDAVDAFVERVAPVPSPFSSAFLEPMGGAIARRDPGETAFPHRERHFCVTAVPKWEGRDRDGEMKAWADGVFEALEPYAADGAYVNYLDELEDAAGPESGARAAYGPNWDRLVRIKRRWDPENLFRWNHNVPPRP